MVAEPRCPSSLHLCSGTRGPPGERSQFAPRSACSGPTPTPGEEPGVRGGEPGGTLRGRWAGPPRRAGPRQPRPPPRANAHRPLWGRGRRTPVHRAPCGGRTCSPQPGPRPFLCWRSGGPLLPAPAGGACRFLNAPAARPLPPSSRTPSPFLLEATPTLAFPSPHPFPALASGPAPQGSPDGSAGSGQLSCLALEPLGAPDRALLDVLRDGPGGQLGPPWPCLHPRSRTFSAASGWLIGQHQALRKERPELGHLIARR